jgi:enterochelin esterase-like enzyme
MAQGTTRRLRLASRALQTELPVSLWTGPRAGPDAPLIVVHDGPEYVRRARLYDALDRPLRAALLTPVDRNETYSASAAYARALGGEVLPALAGAHPVGVGCSLGAVALLHAHRRYPDAFAGLFLQSGSFFRGRTDPQERGFPRFGRIARFVGSVLREPGRPIPVTITCGTREENLANNRAVAAALAEHGYEVALHEEPGGHDWPSWRRALKARLPDLLERAWST